LDSVPTTQYYNNITCICVRIILLLRKNTKKISNEEKENVVSAEQNDFEVALNSTQEKPKSRRGIKKVKIDVR